MGNEMLRSLVVFGYGKGVDKMYVAVLMPFSLNEKHLSGAWKVSESESLLLPVFFQRIISRHFGAATCTSVIHVHLCHMRVRKNRGQCCISGEGAIARCAPIA